MSIKVERKGNKISVETDYYDSFGTSHSSVYNDRELTAAMKLWRIEKVEARVPDSIGADSYLRDEFDKKFVEKSGRKYFGL